MNWLYAIIAGMLLLAGSYWLGGHQQRVNDAAAGAKAVSEAQAAAKQEQANEDAKLVREAQSAVDTFKKQSASFQAQLSVLSKHAIEVKNVPEVKSWRCTPIPAELLAGLSVSSRSGDCAGPDKVSTGTSGAPGASSH